MGVRDPRGVSPLLSSIQPAFPPTQSSCVCGLPPCRPSPRLCPQPLLAPQLWGRSRFLPCTSAQFICPAQSGSLSKIACSKAPPVCFLPGRCPVGSFYPPSHWTSGSVAFMIPTLQRSKPRPRRCWDRLHSCGQNPGLLLCCLGPWVSVTLDLQFF